MIPDNSKAIDAKMFYKDLQTSSKFKNTDFKEEIILKQKIEECFQYRWSNQLMANNIKINGNVSTVAKDQQINNYRCWKFSLVEAGFNQDVKKNQFWAFKIKQKTGGMDLGVCLKNILQDNNFKYQDINWFTTGHGLYMKGSTGCCYSHQLKEFNHVERSFKFSKGDVIYVQYNPIKEKIIFCKNQGQQKFEMPISPPPVGDAYHPCVAFHQQNDSVELIKIEEPNIQPRI